MSLAPIALFVYNRLQHTQKTIEALQKNKLASQSDLVVFSDGSKNNQDSPKVAEVRDYIQNIAGFKNIRLVLRESNFGLAESIISGVSEIVSEYGRIIVLEDDLVTSPYFLQYMNEALEKYEKNDKVISIHGYVYPVDGELPETFFLRGADCWGWGTWKRGWKIFEKDGEKLLGQLKLKKLERLFDFGNTYPYVSMLEDQIRGLNNSWAIRWYASAFVENKLTLYPGKSLVKNIGFDSSGTHCGATDVWDVNLADVALNLGDIKVCDNNVARALFMKYFRSVKFRGKIDHIKSFLKKIIIRNFFRPGWYSILINPYFIARYHLARSIHSFSKPLKNKKILDVGCGDKPYELFFEGNEYIGIDIQGGGHKDVYKKVNQYYNGKKIPYPSENFDTVICTQVLEHTEDPNELLNEICRVIVPGGKLYLTMPFVWSEHEEPFDFQRFTRYKHNNILLKNGFQIEKLSSTTGIFGTVGQLISAYFFEKSNVSVLKVIISVFVCFPIQLFFLFLDFLFNRTGITLDYIIVAKKK